MLTWQNPALLFALALVAAPILIHILVQRRAEPLPFPTLRFLQPTRLASIRRHLIDDGALLAVRAAILAAAVAAFAGPLVITPARRQAWDRRLVRASVIDASSSDAARAALAATPPAFLSREFTASSLPDGMRRAAAWLESSPPARRELIVASPFPIGSITTADVAAIPRAIGVRFARAGALPPVRTIDAGPVLAIDGLVAREATLDGPRTVVRETPIAGGAALPIEIVNSRDARPAVDAAVAAVLSQRVQAPGAGHRARVVIVDPARNVETTTSQVLTPWIADAIARVMRDPDLQTAARRVAAGFDGPRLPLPWLPIAAAADGRPLAAAAEDGERLIVASAAPPADLFTPVLLRAIANSLGVLPDLTRAEVVPIPDPWLREHERAPSPPVPPTGDALRNDDHDNDRRGFWLAALALLAIEGWMRRSRQRAAEAREEASRVA